jgi:hypothetical protein
MDTGKSTMDLRSIVLNERSQMPTYTKASIYKSKTITESRPLIPETPQGARTGN